jgi:hypothetical protein
LARAGRAALQSLPTIQAETTAAQAAQLRLVHTWTREAAALVQAAQPPIMQGWEVRVEMAAPSDHASTLPRRLSAFRAGVVEVVPYPSRLAMVGDMVAAAARQQWATLLQTLVTAVAVRPLVAAVAVQAAR